MDQVAAGVKGKVCVTGAAGFLASWLIKRLLLSGYHVTGTVRDPGDEEKVGHLWRLEGARERLLLVRADLMVDGSFDAAIMGCEGVFHTASPVLGLPTHDPKAEILQPAIDGTLNVLRSCKKKPSLKRVFSPLLPQLSGYVFLSQDLVRSKTQAEKAAWHFCELNEIDLVTVIPSFIIGPSLPPVLCKTASDVLGLLKGETEKFEWHGRMGYVHVNDVALTHILVYENESAKGRYICSSTVVDNDELVAILSARYPALPIPKRFKRLDRPYSDLNVSKLKGLGMKFRSIEEMFDDCVESLTNQGHLPSIV